MSKDNIIRVIGCICSIITLVAIWMNSEILLVVFAMLSCTCAGYMIGKTL